MIATSNADVRAGALATYFTAAYIGIAVPVIGAGAVLQFVSPRVTLLVFGIVVGVGMTIERGSRAGARDLACRGEEQDPPRPHAASRRARALAGRRG